MRVVRKIVKYFIIVLITLIVGLTTAGFLFESKFTGLIGAEINKHLTRKVHILPENISLTLLDKFPSASIKFENIYAFDNDDTTSDTLFYLNKLYVSFNLLDLINNKVEINQVDLEEGAVNIRYSQWGSPNFKIWKEDTTSSSDVQFKIDDINISKVRFTYQDIKENQLFQIHVSDFHNQLFLNDSATTVMVKGDYKHLNLNHYWKESPLINGSVNSKLIIGPDEVTISPSRIQAFNNELEVKGRLNGQKNQIDVQVGNLQLNPLKGLNELEVFKKELQNVNGGISIHCQIQQTGANKYENRINYSWQQKSYQLDSLTLNNVFAKGYFYQGNINYPDRFEVAIDSSSFELNQQNISCKGTIKDGKYLNLNGYVKGQLDKLAPFSSSIVENKVTGTHQTKYKLVGTFDQISQNPIQRIKIEGQIDQFNLSNQENAVTIKDASFYYKFFNDRLTYKDFEGSYNDTPLRSSGFVTNITNDGVMSIVANVNAPFVDLEKIVRATDSDNTTDIIVPENVQFDLSVNIDQFVSNEFKAQKVNGDFKYLNKQLYFFPLSLHTAEGRIQLRGKFDARNKNEINLKCNTDFSHINLPLFFQSFNNFGQTYVTNEHLEGFLSGSLETNIPFDLQLNPNLKSLYVITDVKIENGRLRNNESMKELAEFMKMEELNDISFSTLKNRIRIENETIYIPEMDIKSSALNLNLAGKHGFDQQVDYEFVLILNEILAARAKKKKKETESFGTIIDDDEGGMRLFIKMTGHVDDPQIKYDRKSMTSTIKQEIKEEKKDLKQAIIDEFKSFKKNKKEEHEEKNESESVTTEENVPNFEIEWDEEDDWN